MPAQVRTHTRRKDKGNDYSEIADLVREKCCGLVYLGLHNENFTTSLTVSGLPVADVRSMKDAAAAYRMAKKVRLYCSVPVVQVLIFSKTMRTSNQFKEFVKAL